MSLFKTYMVIVTFIITILLATIVWILIYAGYQIKSETNNLNQKITSFNQNINAIYKNIQTENSTLKTQLQAIPKYPSLP
jgi:predicted PurR-regulated permease PerM